MEGSPVHYRHLPLTSRFIAPHIPPSSVRIPPRQHPSIPSYPHQPPPHPNSLPLFFTSPHFAHS
ncbi:hypothetical protein E2C01_099894 [Portunus trituberculatus]|uniref:Uncharacterized protein n=1 Tax=Portunus trituberculatus TaxID=210409 RepID=A0A5B7KAP2_PORTR|nr:hypothetical protein [Portunus trituberculatus]